MGLILITQAKSLFLQKIIGKTHPHQSNETMKEIEFDKMQGLGNDYVYLTCLDALPYDMTGLAHLARAISDRHFGIGGDGMVVITRSGRADFRMIMFNADGSEAQMCGNASRCIARLVYEKGLTSKREFTLETLAGIKHLTLNFSGDSIESVSVDMGKPFLAADTIPVVPAEATVVSGSSLILHTVEMDGTKLGIHCIGMGNPHGVIFMTPDEDFFQINGPRLECHSIWPEKANIEFVEVLDPHTIRMRVWERGTGETLACGTGACASAVVSILTGKTENDVTVIMKGGQLNVRLDGKGNVIMTGDAQHVARGTYFYNEH